MLWSNIPMAARSSVISLARSGLAMKAFAPVLAAAGLEGRLAADVSDDRAGRSNRSIDGDGLVAFWPRAHGNVSLTAWAYAFLVAAEKAGEPVDKTLTRPSLQCAQAVACAPTIRGCMRGDELRERVEALTALAEGGELDEAYVGRS